jgi:hypothetical protein
MFCKLNNLIKIIDIFIMIVKIWYFFFLKKNKIKQKLIFLHEPGEPRAR